MKDIQKIFPEISDSPIIMAGPCSAESRDQVMSTARELAHGGVKIFRAGVWKPRTKPGGFEGRGAEALDWLREVKESTGMLIATEVATPEHLRLALEAGVDCVWIGARTSANPFAVQELADALAQYPQELRDSLTVLVKNPVNPDIELWIGALERIRRAGISHLGAIHRGFSVYGPQLYRNAPMWRIPIELSRRLPGISIIVDPSHIGGRRELVPILSQQALDMNFDGLIIESHCNPDCALSDAAQQITPMVLTEMLGTLIQPARHNTGESLAMLRRQIDSADDELLALLSRRMGIARDIGRYKHEQNIPVVQPGRYGSLMDERVKSAQDYGLDPEFVKHIFAEIHEESVRQQIEIGKKM